MSGGKVLAYLHIGNKLLVPIVHTKGKFIPPVYIARVCAKNMKSFNNMSIEVWMRHTTWKLKRGGFTPWPYLISCVCPQTLKMFTIWSLKFHCSYRPKEWGNNMSLSTWNRVYERIGRKLFSLMSIKDSLCAPPESNQKTWYRELRIWDVEGQLSAKIWWSTLHIEKCLK